MKETTKQEFISDFGSLCAKHNINNIKGMRYENDGLDEKVYITYDNNSIRTIYVTYDSKTAMINDIIKQGGLS